MDQIDLFEVISTRTCNTCNVDLSLDNYYRNENRCKKCQRVVDDARREKSRKFVFYYYATHPCVDCGESDPTVLQLDHVRGEKYQNVSVMVGGRTTIKTIKQEMEKCVVRCANCHAKKTAREGNWYKGYYNHQTQEINTELDFSDISDILEISKEILHEQRWPAGNCYCEEGSF